MKVYVVYGTSGEYSDREIWVVGGFYSKDKAEELVVNAAAESRRIYLLAQEKSKSKPRFKTNDYWRKEKTPEEKKIAAELHVWLLDFNTDEAMKSKYDENYTDIDMYAEARYYYEEVELMDG